MHVANTLTMVGSNVFFSSSGSGGKTKILTFSCQFCLKFLSMCQSYFNYIVSISEINLSNFTLFSFKGKDPQQRPVFLICGCSKGSSYSCVALKKLAALLWCQDTQQNAQKSGVWNPVVMVPVATRKTKKTFQRTAVQSPNVSVLMIHCSIPKTSWQTLYVNV